MNRVNTFAALLVLPLLGACSAPQSAPNDELTVSPANELRQGQAGVELTLTRASGGLANPSQIDFQDLAVTLEPSSTDARLRLSVTVPHGAAPGPRSLTLTTSNGTTTELDVVAITAITASPEGLDSQLGTTEAPFRTVAQALRVSGAGDTVELRKGTYADSEAWGYAVPDRVTIHGESPSTTLLEGAGNAPTALESAAHLTLSGLTVSGFDIGVKAEPAAQLALANMAISSAISAIEVDGDDVSVDVTESALNVPGEAALRVADGSHRSQVSLHGAQLTGGLFDADPEATLLVDSTTIDARASSAGVNFAGAKLGVSSSSIRVGTGAYGVSLRSGAASFDHVTIEGGAYGVYQLTGSSKLRDTQVDGFASVGLYYASGAVDLGTATEAGNNAFQSSTPSAEAYGIYVNLDTSPVTCSNTSFNGLIPSPGTVKAGTEALSLAGAYLLNPGQTLQFYRVN